MQVEGQHGASLLALMATGEWVSNANPTCPSLGYSLAKVRLMPDVPAVPPGIACKDSSVTDGDASD